MLAIELVMSNFRFNQLKGTIAKEMVRGLLEDSGYKAYPFGYESLLTQIRYDIHKRKMTQTDSIRRLRSMPDLLVYDEDNGQVWFTEVKFRRVDSPKDVAIGLEQVSWYQKYWNDSVLVVVIPVESVFYAQYVSKLQLEGLGSSDRNQAIVFDLAKEFLPIEQIFSKIKPETMKNYYSLFDKFPVMDVYEEYPEEFDGSEDEFDDDEDHD